MKLSAGNSLTIAQEKRGKVAATVAAVEATLPSVVPERGTTEVRSQFVTGTS